MSLQRILHFGGMGFHKLLFLHYVALSAANTVFYIDDSRNNIYNLIMPHHPKLFFIFNKSLNIFVFKIGMIHQCSKQLKGLSEIL